MHKPDLISLWGLSSWPVVGLLKEDLLHLAVLQVVELSDCVLGPHDQVNQDSLWSPSPNKCMLCAESSSFFFKLMFFNLRPKPLTILTNPIPEDLQNSIQQTQQS